MTSTTAVVAADPAPVAGGLGRAVTLRGRRYPVLLPKIRDPRLHVASVIVTVQVLGQVVLGFDVSVAQILITIGTAAVLELLIVAVTRQEIAWPASALLTGNGIALLLRTPGTEHGDWWSTKGWPIFVAAAGISLLSKYAIRVGDRHVFNPSNLGLVIVFLVFGSDRADPQDLWWGPWRPALAITLGVILVGGITLSVRLRLFSVAATFWVTFAGSIAVLAANGHAISARWHFGPVEGWAYWRVLVFSPEIVIFVFFMITDPRTAPIGRVARPVYAASVGVFAGILAGLQRTEFATKVSLLLALTLVCAARPALERWLPDERFLGERRRWVRARVEGDRVTVRPTPGGLGAIGALAIAALVVVGLAGASTPAPSSGGQARVVAGAAGQRPTVSLPAGAVPRVSIDPALAAIPGAVTSAQAQAIGRDVVGGLAIEADAIGARDRELAATAAIGERLALIEATIERAGDGQSFSVSRYQFDALEVVLLRDPVSPQAVPQLGLRASGTVTVLRYRDSVADGVVDQDERPAERLYLVTEVGGHYLIGAALAPSSPMLVGS